MQNSNKLLSICIPTYNRGNRLIDLLESANSTFENNIEIIIVDDGSTDKTRDLVKEFSCKSGMCIKYIYQENMGRSHALNRAILATTSEYTVIMDSDDIFTRDGIDIIISKILTLKKGKEEKDIAGFIFLCSDFSCSIIGDKFPENLFVGNILKLVSDFQISGDKKEVIKSNVIKDILYIPYTNEKRMATSIIWNRVSSRFNVYVVNKVVSMKDYSKDGMSNNIDCIRLQSPKSSAKYYGELFNYHNRVYSSYKYAFRAAINLIRYSIHLKSLFFILKHNPDYKKKMLLFASIPLSVLLAIKDKIFCKL